MRKLLMAAVLAFVLGPMLALAAEDEQESAAPEPAVAAEEQAPAEETAEPAQEAEEVKTSISLTGTYAERYYWRGLPLNDEATFQTGAELSRDGFTLGVWYNFELTRWGREAGYESEKGNATEIDYYGSYTIPLGEKLEFTGGFLTYSFPHTGMKKKWAYYQPGVENDPPWASTTEIFAGLAADVPLSPSITFYLDQTENEGGNYTSLDFAHSFELAGQDETGVSLDLSAHLGYANFKFYHFYYEINQDSDFSDWNVTAALPISLPGGFTITPTYIYTAAIPAEAREEILAWDQHPELGIFLGTLSWELEF